MKTVTRTLMIAAFLAAASTPAFAVTTGRVPDAGSSAILLAMGATGLVVVRRFFGKK